MRIALFLPSLAGGGAQRVFLLLARGLTRRGYGVDLVAPNMRGSLANQVPSDVRIVPLGTERVATAVVPLARYMRKERPAAVLSAMTHGNVIAIGAARLARVRTHVLVTEHQHLSTFVVHADSRRDRMLPYLVGATYRFADTIVAVSEGVASDLAGHAGLPRARIEVVHNPVPVEELTRLASKPVAHEWARPGAKPLVLAIGRLTTQKDFATLVRAFACVTRGVDCRLIILGDGPLRSSLESLIWQLGLHDRVDLPGFVENPYPFMRAAAVLALSSRWEGLPTVLLEAMALEVPIVATDCPSGPRELLARGRLGALVPPGDEAALAGALTAELSHPRAGRGREAVSDLSVDRVAGRYLALLGLPPDSGCQLNHALVTAGAVCAG
jgi:glycosyltransferase involved in cell wall biosynthesis